MAEVDILVKGIKEIYETRGSEAFSDARMFNALLDDLIPGVSNERKIIHKTVDDVLLKDLFDMVTDNSSNKQLEAMRIIKKIEDSCGLSPKYSCFIVETFCAAFDVSVDFTSYKQNIKNTEEKSNNNSTDTYSRKKVKPVVKNVNAASNFDDKKFINDLYYCETVQRILDDRIEQIDDKLTELQSDEDAVSKLCVSSWNESVFYKEYKKGEKRVKSHPQKPQKPQKPKGSLFKYSEYSDFFEFIEVFLDYLVGGAILFGVLWVIGFMFFGNKAITGPLVIAVIAVILVNCWLLGFFKWIKVAIDYKKKIHEYEEKLKIHEDNCKKIDENNALIVSDNEKLLNSKKEQYDEWAKKETKAIEEKRQKSNIVIANERNIFNKEKDIANATLSKSEDLLDFLYSLKVNGVQCIHSNYQSFVSICIIYGYFDMGRCNSLKGYQGAYNLYEDEKSKEIIDEEYFILTDNTTMSYPQNAHYECKGEVDTLDENTKSLIDNEVLTSKEILIDVPVVNDTYYKEIDLKLDEIETDYSNVA